MNDYRHTIYGILLLGILILLTFSESANIVFEKLISYPLGVFLENAMPIYTPIAIIGFPVMYLIYRMIRTENVELKKRVESHVTRWENFSKKEEDVSKTK